MTIAVQGISHATFETPDPVRMTDYYVDVIGLTLASRDGDAVHFATATGLPALTLKPGAVARCSAVAFRLPPGSDLDAAGEDLRHRHGLSTRMRSDRIPGAARILSFPDPNGTEIELVADLAPLPPDRTPRDFVALKFGHIAFKTTALEACVRFYQEVLGFRVSDWRGDFFVWMRCGPDHHTANFVRGDSTKMHHLAFEVKDVAEIVRACDVLGRKGHKVIYGPGRHVIGDNVFVYHRNPDGQIVELYTELARMDHEPLNMFAPRPWRRDNPYTPRIWGSETVGNLWGPGAPPGFSDG